MQAARSRPPGKSAVNALSRHACDKCTASAMAHVPLVWTRSKHQYNLMHRGCRSMVGLLLPNALTRSSGVHWIPAVSPRCPLPKHPLILVMELEHPVIAQAGFPQCTLPAASKVPW